MNAALTIVWAAAVYLAFGSAFGLWFVARGIDRFDPAAKGAGFLFRAIVFWGSAALWPLLLGRILRGGDDGKD
jgi:hypothetical protein